MHVGTATRRITSGLGSELCGQLFRRQATAVRDELEANLVLIQDTHCAVLLVGLDLLGYFEAGWIAALRRALAGRAGLDEAGVLVFSTHTHCGPVTYDLLPDAPIDRDYLAGLQAALCDAVDECRRGLAAARLWWGHGEVRIGHNRRLRFADGSARTYGNIHDPKFVGVEGPDDPAHTVLWGEDPAGRVCFVLMHNTAHATCIENACVISADFPGEARRLVREALGEVIPVLYLAGAGADLSPWNLFDESPLQDGEARLKEIGKALADETLRILYDPARQTAEPLDQRLRVIHSRLRLPPLRQLARAIRLHLRGVQGLNRAEQVVRVHSPLLLLRHWILNRGREALRLHALRLGALCILTNPTETYCEFGRRMKQGSGAAATLVGSLCDGFAGYCPTPEAIQGGGYSAEVGYWCRLAPETGDAIIAASLEAAATWFDHASS